MGVPVIAAAGPFEVLRSSDAATVKSTTPYDSSLANPYIDVTGSLTDGLDHYYVVRDGSGAFVDIEVDKDRTNNRVMVMFDDTVPVPDADPSLSSVSAVPSSVPADGVSVAMITITPRDADGQLLGPGLQLDVDLLSLAPGELAGPIQDMGDGTYVVSIVASQIGSGEVVVDVNGVVLDDRPVLTFQSAFADEFLVNVVGLGDQTHPSVGQATNGGSVMIFVGDDGDGDGILGRIFDPDGNPVGGEFVVNSTTTGSQQDPEVAVGADRSFVVVWESGDADGSGVYSQLYDAHGDPVGGETLVNVVEHNNQVDPDVVMADDGSYVVVWRGADSDGDGIHLRMFDAFGQAISSEFLVNTDESGDQQDPQAAMTGDGRFVVTWQSTSGGNQGIFAQLYTAAGAPFGLTIDVHLGLNGQEGIPRVDMADVGSFTLVWQGHDGGSLGILARSYDPAGLPYTPAEVPVNSYTNGVQDRPDVAMADDGRVLIVWHDHSNHEIRAQHFDTTATPVGAEFLVSDPAVNKADNPVASLAGDGSSYLILYEAEDGNGMGVFASWVPLQ